GDRNLQVVDDVQHRHNDDEGTVEPVAYVQVLDVALQQGAEEHDAIGNPDDGDQDVDRPFQLGVLLGGGEAEGQGNGGEQDHQLPAPEGERGQLGREQRGLAGALHGVVGGGEQGAAAECEDHCVGVQRTQAAEACPGEVEVEGGPSQLGGDQDADKHPDDAPHHRHDGKLADHLVVIGGTGCCVHVWASIHGFGQSAAS